MENHPTIVNVDREKMKTLEALAKATMDVSDAQAHLQGLQSIETEYLAEREGLAAAAVERVLVESEEILDDTAKNYQGALSIAATTANLSDRVGDILNRVKSILSLFDEKSRLWEAKVKRVEEGLTDAKNVGRTLKASLDGRRIANDQHEAKLVEWEKELISREDALKRDVAEITANNHG